jgi:CRISPR system Cascade subunit CasA
VHPEFNLIDDPWIQAQRLDGTVECRSISGLLQDAHEYSRITGDLPTQALPILRLLLAIVHRAIEGPVDREAWEELWEAESLPMEVIEGYLKPYRHRFDLFHPEAPFYQVAGLTKKKPELGLAAFIADVPTGNPKYATRAAEGLQRMDFGEAARWLVHCHAFDVAGIKGAADGDSRAKKGKSYSIGPGSLGRLGAVYPEGDNLAETILLNLIPDHRLYKDGPDPADVPVWERDPHGPSPEPRGHEGKPHGPLDLYTWQSRRLRLVAEDGYVTGALICQGDRLELRDQFDNEPMTVWRRSKVQERKLKEEEVYLPRRHDPTRAIWRGLAAMLRAFPERSTRGIQVRPALVFDWIAEVQYRLGTGKQIKYHITGIDYGTQEAVISEVIDDRVTVAAAVFDDSNRDLATMIVESVEDAEAAIRALTEFARNLARAGGARDGLDGAGDAASETAYAVLDLRFREWLAALNVDSNADEERTKWQHIVRYAVLDIAGQLVNASGPSAWRGRRVDGKLINSAIAQISFRRKLNRALKLTAPAQNTATDGPTATGDKLNTTASTEVEESD